MIAVDLVRKLKLLDGQVSQALQFAPLELVQPRPDVVRDVVQFLGDLPALERGRDSWGLDGFESNGEIFNIL